MVEVLELGWDQLTVPDRVTVIKWGKGRMGVGEASRTAQKTKAGRLRKTKTVAGRPLRQQILEELGSWNKFLEKRLRLTWTRGEPCPFY